MYIRLAIKEAKKSIHRMHKHAAIVLRGGKLIAIGRNSAAIHAECSALHRAFKSGTEGATLIVIRIRRDGNIGMSKPCPMCMNKLINAGIKKVMYSDFDGSIKTMKLPSRDDVKLPIITTKSRVITWNRSKV